MQRFGTIIRLFSLKTSQMQYSRTPLRTQNKKKTAMQLARCLRVNYELPEEEETSEYEDLVFAIQNNNTVTKRD